MKRTFVLLFVLIFGRCQMNATEYNIPPSIRYSLDREESSSPIIYYFFEPNNSLKTYPIFIICDGSDIKDQERSVFYIMDFFKERVRSLDVGYLAIEKCGIDGNDINQSEFWNRYTRSQRLKDHLRVIHRLKENPPPGWNGQFIFAGVSEGGALVADLCILCPNTLATISWSGVGDWSWPNHLWQFLDYLKKDSFWFKLYDSIPRWFPFSSDIPSTRLEFDALFQEITTNPSPDRWMAGMTYLYHADAFLKPPIEYSKIKSPFLVVAGIDDSILESCDQFVEKGLNALSPITYFRVVGMDHYIRKRPDIIDKSFDWLRQQIAESNSLELTKINLNQ
jgi:hypothetical protein